MDMKTALTFRGPFEEAYQQSRESEIVNQQRVAQAQQLLQEARLKAEDMEMKKRMEPFDIESKQAAAAFNRANAHKMMQEKAPNPKHTADAQTSFQKRIYPYVVAIHEEKDPVRKQQLRDALRTEAASYNVQDFDMFIDSPSFIKALARDSTTAKLQGIENQGRVTIDLQGLKGDQAIEQIREKGKWAIKAAESKAKLATGKPSKESYEQAAVAYRRAADSAQTEEEYNNAIAKAEEFDRLAKEKAAAAAVAGPQAKMDAAKDFMAGQGSTGRGTGAANQVKPKVGADGWITLPDGTRVRQKPKE